MLVPGDFQKPIKLHSLSRLELRCWSIDPDDGHVWDRGSAATDGLIGDNYGIPCGCHHRRRRIWRTNEFEQGRLPQLPAVHAMPRL